VFWLNSDAPMLLASTVSLARTGATLCVGPLPNPYGITEIMGGPNPPISGGPDVGASHSRTSRSNQLVQL